MHLAVDAGYGYTKAAAETGRRSHFLSVVAPARGTGELARALGGAAPKHRVSVDVARDTAHPATGAWLVGDAALLAGASRTWDAASARRDYDVLTLAAAASVGPEDGEEIELAAGLPLAVWLNRAERRALRERLTGLTARVSVDDADAVLIRIAEARVFPQGLGAYVAALNTPAYERLGRSAGGVGVVDVGFRTTDCMLLVPNRAATEGSLTPAEEGCFSLDLGAGQVYQRVRQKLEALSGKMLPPAVVEDALDILGAGRLTVGGVDYDVAALAADEARVIAETVAAEARRAWGARYELLTALLVTGGGGKLCWPGLRAIHPCAMLAPEPLFGNALGFLVLAGARKTSWHLTGQGIGGQ